MAKRKIKAKKIVEDVRAGLSDAQLMERHGLTPRTLQYVFRKLVQAGLMSDLDFYERSKLTESDVFRAFSDEADPVLRCPGCGQALSDRGEDCVFCITIDSTTRASPFFKISDELEPKRRKPGEFP